MRGCGYLRSSFTVHTKATEAGGPATSAHTCSRHSMWRYKKYQPCLWNGSSHNKFCAKWEPPSRTLIPPRRLRDAAMLNERAQIVLSVQPLNGEDDRRLVTDALLRLEGVRTAHVDIPRGVVRVDGAASDVELLATMDALGKRAAVVTHTRGVKTAQPQSGGMLRFQLFMKLLGRQANCCS